MKTFRDAFLALILFSLLGWIVYGQAVLYPFLHDDVVFIQQNPRIAHLMDFSFLFSSGWVGEGEVGLMNPYYRPFLEFFYRLEYQLFGFNAAGYHAVNILFHVINAFMVFLILQNIISRRAISLILALTFLLHPIQSEAVVCIAGASNVVMAFFFLLSFWCYLKDRRRWSLIFYVFALLTKEQAIVLPILIILHHFCFEKSRVSSKEFLRPLGLFLLVTIFYLLWRSMVLQDAATSIIPSWHELSLRLQAIPATLLMYGKILLFPRDLHYYRSVDILNISWWSWPLFIGIVVGSGVILRKAPSQTSRLMTWGMGWFGILLLPSLILPLIYEYSLIAAFEHFLYLPMLGFFIFLFIGLDHVFSLPQENLFRKICRLTMVIFFILLMMMSTIAQTVFWRFEQSLFDRASLFEPQLGRVQLLAARAHSVRGEYVQAVGKYEKALIIFEGYLQKTTVQGPRSLYQKFVNEIRVELAQTHNNIGVLQIHQGNFEKALDHFEESVKFNPHDLGAKTNMAVCYLQAGKSSQGKEVLRGILEDHPDFEPAQQVLGVLEQSQ
ncbi:MAG: tetratricopeptide repeat protein [Candidatus Omnitrophica bacterium]|nr:tetratricopeptide repeat protein [Candidatus Omnitrophota bacterium]